MRITFILSRFPWPLDKGDKLRAFYQMKQMAMTHEVNVIALTETNVSPDAIDKLSEFCQSITVFRLNRFAQGLNITLSLFKGKPLQVGYFYSSRINLKLNRKLEATKPDVVFCQLIRTAEYGKNAKTLKVLDYQDALSVGLKRRIKKSGFFLRQILKIEYKRLQHYEKQIFDSFDKHTIITQTDRDLIPHTQNNSIIIIPNGVDMNHFFPMDNPKKYDFIFAGNMNYPPNVDAALFLVEKIMPIVWKSIPSATLVLAGANPAAEVQRLKNDNVHITGWIEDIADAYASAKVFVAPMRIGTGLQNKLLEAMAMKLPAVTTSLANEALKAINQESILVGDTSKKIAEQLIRLLNEKDLYHHISQSGYDFVIENYSWDKVGKLLNEMLKER